jgi:hypothetical protein
MVATAHSFAPRDRPPGKIANIGTGSESCPETDYGAIVEGLRVLKQRKEAASCRK